MVETRRKNGSYNTSWLKGKGHLISGENNPNWKGGISKNYKPKFSRRTKEYKIWRQTVIDRDKECLNCTSNKRLEVHHIKPFHQLEENELYNIKNGITLCRECHKGIKNKENKYETILHMLRVCNQGGMVLCNKNEYQSSFLLEMNMKY